MPPSKASSKSVTPSSVKGLIVIEGMILGFLSFWMVNEYMNNLILQASVRDALGPNLTTYTMIVGLAIGLGGTLAAFSLWRNLKQTNYKLERASSPRLKGPVRHALSRLPTIDEETPLDPSQTTSTALVEAPPAIPTATSEIPPSNTTTTATPNPANTPTTNSSTPAGQTGQPAKEDKSSESKKP